MPERPEREAVGHGTDGRADRDRQSRWCVCPTTKSNVIFTFSPHPSLFPFLPSCIVPDNTYTPPGMDGEMSGFLDSNDLYCVHVHGPSTHTQHTGDRPEVRSPYCVPYVHVNTRWYVGTASTGLCPYCFESTTTHHIDRDPSFPALSLL